MNGSYVLKNILRRSEYEIVACIPLDEARSVRHDEQDTFAETIPTAAAEGHRPTPFERTATGRRRVVEKYLRRWGQHDRARPAAQQRPRLPVAAARIFAEVRPAGSRRPRRQP